MTRRLFHVIEARRDGRKVRALMFYYYGRKALIAKLYPEPLYDTIVEPFAGSAAYSLHGDRWQNRVMLNDLDPGVAAAWRWLINDATPADVLALPRMKQGDKLDAHTHLSDGERWFMVYNINPAACQNSNVCSRNGADRVVHRDVARLKRQEADLVERERILALGMDELKREGLA